MGEPANFKGPANIAFPRPLQLAHFEELFVAAARHQKSHVFWSLVSFVSLSPSSPPPLLFFLLPPFSPLFSAPAHFCLPLLRKKRRATIGFVRTSCCKGFCEMNNDYFFVVVSVISLQNTSCHKICPRIPADCEWKSAEIRDERNDEARNVQVEHQ